jgi:hypothetical protein
LKILDFRFESLGAVLPQNILTCLFQPSFQAACVFLQQEAAGPITFAKDAV